MIQRTRWQQQCSWRVWPTGLSKVFDTVGRKILVAKPDYYGLRDIHQTYFTSWCNRKQYGSAQYTSSQSYILPIVIHVPQGSPRGPVLLLLYTSEAVIMQANKVYVDDTTLFTSYPNLQSLFVLINQELDNVRKWITCNKLALDIHKTIGF